MTNIHSCSYYCDRPECIKAQRDELRDKLAQPEQEPRCAVIVEVFGKDWRLDYMSLPVGKHKLYTQQYIYATPSAAQRTWVGLTDDEIKEIVGPYGDAPIKGYTRKLFDQIEAALRSKNEH